MLKPIPHYAIFNFFLVAQGLNNVYKNNLLTRSNIDDLLGIMYQKLIVDHSLQKINHCCFVSNDSLNYPRRT